MIPRSFFNTLSLILFFVILNGTDVLTYGIRMRDPNVEDEPDEYNTHVLIGDFEDARAYGTPYPLSAMKEKDTLDIIGVTPQGRRRLWEDRDRLYNLYSDNDDEKRLKQIAGISEKTAAKILEQIIFR